MVSASAARLITLNTNTAQQATLAAWVDEIIAAKRADARAATSAAEHRIDELVYQLYGLNDTEIAIVKGRA